VAFANAVIASDSSAGEGSSQPPSEQVASQAAGAVESKTPSINSKDIGMHAVTGGDFETPSDAGGATAGLGGSSRAPVELRSPPPS